MRTLQWAAELAISADQAKARLGLLELQALADSHLSDAEVQAFVDAALDAVVEEVAAEVEEHPDAEIEPVPSVGELAVVPDPGPAVDGERPIQSQQDERGGAKR